MGITRIHAWKYPDQGSPETRTRDAEFQLHDVDNCDASKLILELKDQGWSLVHQEVL
jgi:hypothetical protein